MSGTKWSEVKRPRSPSPASARWLTAIDTETVVGLRDPAIVAILIYTASRAGAVATLKRGSFYHTGERWMLHFDEKGGKSREIPVRHDLEQMIFACLDAAGLRTARKDTPLFRTAYKKTGQLTTNAMYVVDVCRMVKRRLRDAGLPGLLSPHSFPGRPSPICWSKACPSKTCSAWPATPTRVRPASTIADRKKSLATSSSGFRFEWVGLCCGCCHAGRNVGHCCRHAGSVTFCLPG